MHNFLSHIKLLFSVLLIVSTLHAAELNWGNDYNKALEQAKKDKKLVYLFIGANDCKHCERFKKLTLSREDVIKDMKEQYVLLFMSRDEHEVPERFEKYGVPRHYFLTPEGEVIATGQGSREVEGWYDVLDEVELLAENFINDNKEKQEKN